MNSESDKERLVPLLDQAVEQAVRSMMENGECIPVGKNKFMVGTLSIIFQAGAYSVLDEGSLLYSDISFFDAALVIAQRHNKKQFSIVREVLTLELQFSKCINDILCYLHSCKSAKKNKDTKRLCILEDRCQQSLITAKHIKQKVTRLKR